MIRMGGAQARWAIVAITATFGMTAFGMVDVHADHVDNHIWIETADGKFITSTKAVTDAYETTHRDIDDACYLYPENDSAENRQRGEYVTRLNNELGDGWSRVKDVINNVSMIKPFTGCGETSTEREMASRLDIDFTYYHECLCSYWYANQIKDRYTYTVTDLPDRRDVPESYKQDVLDSIQTGLDMWGDINGMKFTYTDSRLRADILILQEIPRAQYGDAYTLANGDIGCLVGNEQCTIQLFTDLNLKGEQTLVEPDKITETIAHELGHNFGLPHNIDHDGVLSSLQEDNVRTYYEVYGINVPSVVEQHTHDQETPHDKTPHRSYGATVIIPENGASPGCEKTNECFVPSTVTIDVGGTVTWRNTDLTFGHTVASGVLIDGGPDGKFSSGVIQPFFSFSYTFEEAGEYPYFCLVHPWMEGLVIVQEVTATNSGQTVDPPDDDTSDRNTPSHDSLDQRLGYGELAGADLRSVDLTDIDLRGADLSGADLRGVNLAGLNLSRADLTGADLYRANLRGADLTGANLPFADLSFSYLSGADMERADLTGADISRADMTEADLRRADLRDADLSKVDLSGADLSMSYLRDADLSGANLTGSKLLKSYMQRADLTDADLRGADMGHIDLRDADLSKADLTDVILIISYMHGADLSGANLSGALLTFSYMGEADLSDADLSGADLTWAFLGDADLRGADLTDTSLEFVVGTYIGP